MSLIETSVRRPVAVAAVVILLILFGSVSLLRVPVELTPEVIKPVVTVTTVWPGASPEEIEKEIVQKQEEYLKGAEGALRMTSSSSDSVATITLEYPAGSDRDAAVVDVTNRLAQVPDYPENADEPVVRTADPGANAMAWFVVRAREGSGVDVEKLRDLIEDTVKPRLERIEGVAFSNVFGGQERELQVVVSPDTLVARGLRLEEMIGALRADNINLSAGDIEEGKRRYVVRTLGEYIKPADVERVVLRDDAEGRVYVRDVAEVRLGFKEARGRVRHEGVPVVAGNAIQERGSNALAVMRELKLAFAELNDGVLRQRGLELEQVYDETTYILSSLSLVEQNLFIGGGLAVLVLLLFLGSVRPTIVVATSIPVSVLGAFVGMALLGRTLNVVSLAGLAFAVGMVVDNAIVVLENIDRHYRRGETALRAATTGTTEVWGAVLASALTTIAVFLPVIFVEEQAGQLFKDLSVAICCAVGLSLVVAITVIPAASGQILKPRHSGEDAPVIKQIRQLGAAFRRVPDGVAAVVARLLTSTSARLAVVVILTALSLGLSWLLLPEAEYLPRGNRNLVFGIILPPPGQNIDESLRIGDRLDASLRPHWLEPGAEGAAEPGIESYFFVALEGRAFMGASARDAERAADLVPLFMAPLREEPGIIPIVQQASLFERGSATGRSIEIELKGPDLERLVGLGGRVFGQVMQMFPGAQARPLPGLDIANPQVHVIPDRERLAELGLSVAELGRVIDVFVDGSKVSTYQLDGEEVDLTLMGPESLAERTQDVGALRLFTPAGKVVTVASVAEVRPGTGPEEIRRVEAMRSITILLIPPDTVPLEEAVKRVEREVLAPLEAEGALAPPYRASLSGTADDLRRTLSTLQGDFLLAIAISFLLMAALFESFLYPLVILFSVPLAAVGGFLGLRTVGLFIQQPMDILTMLGFIILVGVVVNNAILIVHQALNNLRDGLARQEAIVESVRTRVRPIFMTVATSAFGMLPLIVMPGAGSELYRGLGSVVVGGLVVSAVFTLFLIPSLFSLVLDARAAWTGTTE